MTNFILNNIKDVNLNKTQDMRLSNENEFENNPSNIYTINEYDELCEEHFKIIKIIPLIRKKKDLLILIFLNIFTIGIINLAFEWFPKWRKIVYTQVSLNESNLLGIYCNDGKLYIIELKKEKIPEIKNPNIQLNILKNATNMYIFTFKLFTYIYNPYEKKFTNFKFSLNSLTKEQIHIQMENGLSENEEKYNRILYGECDLNVEMSSFFQLLFIEFSDPFYIFQIYSIILWYYTTYEKYATVIMIMSILSLLTGTYESYISIKNIKEMAKYSINIKKYKLSKNKTIIEEVNSKILVPGDIFEVPDNGKIIPCDCILLSGSIIINESMLTGESTPIIKSHLPILKNIPFNEENDKQYFLYAGTKIVQKRKIGNKPVLAMVYNIGFNTIKGNLIRSILFPKDLEKKFKSDSQKYIIFMAILTIIAFIPCMFFMIKKANESQNEKEKILLINTLIERGLDLITTTVPPSLPACLSIGTTTAIERLKDYKMICINREKMNFAGKINICVFDKTGTLTEDFLDIEGYISLIPLYDINYDGYYKMVFGKFNRDSKEMANNVYKIYKEKFINGKKKNAYNEINQLFIECLACCQGITKVNDKFIGDPIDVKMFEGINWILNENVVNKKYFDKEITTYVRPNQEKDLNDKLNGINDKEIINKIINEHYEIGIAKRFDFSSKLQRMSVLVKNTNESFFKCFVKGSPEKIKELCKPSSLPLDYNEQLDKCTSKGYRVLAMGYKIIDMNIKQCLEMSRTYAEKNIIFLGFLIVQNKLKKETTSSLNILSNANLRIRMATGDNILTSICVGRKCNLIPFNCPVYSCDIYDIENSNEKELKWKTIMNTKDDNNEIIKINHLNEHDKIINEVNNLNISILKPEPLEKNFEESNELNEVLSSKNLNQKNNNLSKKEVQIQLNDNIQINLPPLPFNESKQDPIIISITGKTFETLYRLNKTYIILKNLKTEPNQKTIQIIEQYRKYNKLFKQILKYTSIYARMSPENKIQLIESLQEESFTVLMCGDGANDCGALKRADVGISLSTEEASIAASFTSSIPNISCVIDLLIEGKSALVTSIQTFKYMMLYSMIQFISVSILMCNGSYLNDWQFMISDIFIIVPLAFLIPLTKSYRKLTYHKPIYDLLSIPIILSILCQTFISGFFQFLILFMTYYRFPNQIGYCGDMAEDEHPECVENTSVFYISFIQYLITAVAFSNSKYFKESIFNNRFLFFYIVLMTFYCEYLIYRIDKFSRYYIKLIAFPDSPQNLSFHKEFGEIFEDYNEDDSKNPKWNFEFKYYIMFLSLVNFIVSIIIEYYFIPWIKSCYVKSKINNIKKKIENNQMDVNLSMINEVNNYDDIIKRENQQKMKKNN